MAVESSGFDEVRQGQLIRLSAAMKFCPETATKLPAGGHETCPVAVMGSARHDVVCLTGSDG
ncbi:hypothetical protein [Rhodococcus qingshengii]|uniref:Ferredoxin n=1 Tax=Rhodococcus qingshengii JCM 15477 TaxID=1303681 RepID=A0AB38RE33_RHOSG|nr:hypothetical protein [Rhodococcus qingshengii]UPU43652.1 hypothetical protein M0639_02845 [Rhodococcus qingshengii JCM 15477]